jgi:Protein of unknown function (DUF1592)/Protein of unknown function (DUF1588)/Protein of unknown function (DUF1595)/Protein of unknown function (DUF1585)/Protein of unknown function (DUF1587)/Cytochrome C oxidase, cbb3-type, subunit III
LTFAILHAADPPAKPTPVFRQYCFQCHGNGQSMGGISLEQLASQASIGESFQKWNKVAAVLEEHRMPPKGMPRPSDEQVQQSLAWIHSELAAYAKAHDGDPGRVTVRRLTSGEYGYAIEDLTGLKLETGIDASTDSVGGEGFTNFGDVQFMQDANLERYLESAKHIADHAVIGAGPIEFYHDPGKSGFEMSAIARIKQIYDANGFRTVSGEGGSPQHLERYDHVLYATWRYQHRAALGEPNATLAQIARREGITPRFAQHVWTVTHTATLGYPASEMAARWQKLPAPSTPDADVRKACAELQKFMTGWPLWLFARGDIAYGGAGDESPLIINDKTLTVEASHHFRYNGGGRGGRGRGATAGPVKVYLNVAAVNPKPGSKTVVIWRNPTIGWRRPGRGPVTPPAGDFNNADGAAVAVAGKGAPPPLPSVPLRSVLTEEMAKKLNFGVSPDGTAIGPNDFASDPSAMFEVALPEGVAGFEFQADAQVGADRDQVYRITFSDREGGNVRGIPVRALIGDPSSAGYRAFKAGVLELVSLLPPNAYGEPTPADKDPIPLPFDSAYNVPEHDDFDTRVKYVRDDKFIYQHILEDDDRRRVDFAWKDLYASFAYHDNYLGILAEHYKYDLKGKHIADLTKADFDAMPAEMRPYATPLKSDYDAAVAGQSAARRGHVEDCLRLAARAWRRPLTEREKQSLRSYYDKAMTEEQDHGKAIRALLARILVSPVFLYRVEQPAESAAVKPLNDWEMASRLSFFLWASIPDEELSRAAATGQLSTVDGIRAQTKRMLADPKARRLATEFFGQWLGFYHFDQFRGVDTTRFPEFTAEVRESMYDEAVSFFEHIVRKDRPVREILFADYDFLNAPLAKFYGIQRDLPKDRVTLVENAAPLQRGGMLRMGAILTAFSAPLRTSPVKRGDWVLRRVLGVAVPPPPADAGSIPADDKLFGGLSLKEKLEAHKRNSTCANCHMRIDPLGFALEHYDSTGRWRDKYIDGKPVDDTSTLTDQTRIAGVQGLLDYLATKDSQVTRTFANKLLGYALGRTVQPSDELLIERMVALGGKAPFSQLVTELVASKQFRNRLGKDDTLNQAGAR